ncbi:MAG: hypothetical protein ACI8S6_001507 [Myxococcota bacterium]
MEALNARLIGIGVRWSSTSADYRQLSQIADLVVTWSGSGDIKATIVGAVEELIADITFDEVWLELASDQYNQADAIQPTSWNDVPSGSTVSFTLTVNSAISELPRDDTYPVTVEVHGRLEKDAWLLDTHTFHVVRPK